MEGLVGSYTEDIRRYLLHVLEYGSIADVAIVVFLSLGIFWIPTYLIGRVLWRMGWSRYIRGKRAMHRKLRAEIHEKIKPHIADLLTDVVDQFYLDGKITAKQRRGVWLKYAQSYGIWDVVPKDATEPTPDPDKLKEDILSRLSPEKREAYFAKLQAKEKRSEPDAVLKAMLAQTAT
jgi:hypothetical protein